MHNSKWKLITVFVMLFTVGNIFAEATKMNLSLKNVTLKQFIEVIENKTDYTFMLDHTVNLSQRISVTSNQEDIETILNKAFLNKNLKYEIAGKQIILAVSSIAMNDNPDKTLTGVVLDETGTPVIGANIIQKGTTNGTISDMDGKFSINVPQGAILIISYIGYNPKEVVVRNFTNLTVNLQEDSRALEEVVVVGYGSVRKSDLTSSVTSVKAEDMLVSAKPDVASALQGIAPGVEVSTNSASPGGDLDIRIRGIGTLNDNTPLYVVDGIPVRSLEFVSPNDIERMEILKDATSSAIYGSRGSSGVILITTKSGKEENGRYVINFDGSLGVQALSRELDMADALEFAKIYNEAREVSNVSGRIDVNSLTGKSTDWLGEISNKSALVQNYNLNVTGGNNISSISAGLGYYNQDGVIKSSNYERYSARINAVIKPNERVTFNFSMIAGHTSRNNIQSEKDQYQGLLFNAYLIDPITEVMKPESEWVDNPFSNYARSQYTMISNPVGVMARTFNNTKQYSGIVNIGMKLDITKALSFKTNVGVDYRDSKRATFNPEFFVNPSEKNDDNKIENSNNYRLGYVWENTLNYQNTFNSKHRINLLAGYTMEYNKSEGLTGSRTNTPGNLPELQFIQLGTLNNNVSGSFGEASMISYLGRVNYSFMDKYIVTANFREDGSSRFAKGNKWGFFPSISGAWVISNESFFPQTAVANYLKLRLGYGQIGNQNISDNAYIDQVQNTYRYPFGSILYPGFATSDPGNRNVKWETTEDMTLGVDGGLFNNSLTWTIDLYSRKTNDMLLRNPVPGFTGLYSSPTSLSAGIWDNVGSIKNQGLEFSLEYRSKINALKYRVGGNIAFVKNEITELGDVNFVSGGNIRGIGDITRTQIKSSIARFWGYKTDGLFQSEEDVLAYSKEGNPIQPNAKPGDLKFIDMNKDGQITDGDKDWIGSPLPTFTAGFNLNLEYNNFDLRAYFYGVYGADLVDANSIFYDSGKDVYNSLAGLYDKAWRPSNPSATHTRLSSRDENGNYQRFSDYMIQDGSYFRLKDLQIGYNFKSKAISRLGMNKLRLYLASQNIFTITSYKGLEPETSSSSVTVLGIDYGNYPAARSFLFGLNVSF